MKDINEEIGHIVTREYPMTFWKHCELQEYGYYPAHHEISKELKDGVKSIFK